VRQQVIATLGRVEDLRASALLPGLSHQQVPILAAIDGDGRHVDAMM
jgi:hypothetical protein